MSRPRLIAQLTFAVAAASACGNESLNVGPETSLSALAPQASRQQQQSGTELPFRGSYTLESSSVPTPPTSHTVTGAQTGTASHLGRFTATSVDVVSTTTATGTGTLNFTAANGDQLFATTSSAQDDFVPPNVSHVTVIATIVGGTGRFFGAAGAFTIHFTQVIDFAAAAAVGSGSFEGTITLSK